MTMVITGNNIYLISADLNASFEVVPVLKIVIKACFGHLSATHWVVLGFSLF